MKYLSLVFLLSVLVFPVFSNENPVSVNITTEYNVVRSIDNGTSYLNKHFVGLGDLTPIIMTYVGKDGSVSVCSVERNSHDIHVYEYSKELDLINIVKFRTEFSKFGAFTKDDQGNYYFFSADNAGEGDFDKINMALEKFDSKGINQNTYRLKAFADNSFNGIMEPFVCGSCRIELSGDMICVYFARIKFKSSDGLNHQSSYGFVIDKNTFQRVDIGQVSNQGISLRGIHVPYISHSFNQFILPIDEGFVFVDQGDAFPRSFQFSKFQKGHETKGLSSFVFKRGEVYQNTFSQLGGLAKTSNGYIFAGTYEKNRIVLGNHNDSRNLFILTFDDDLTTLSETVWITNYNEKDTRNAASPKIVALYEENFLLMWELMSKNSFTDTYTAVINKNGKIIKPIEKIGDVRLNINDPLRYCKLTGNVFWAVNSRDKNIILYAYNTGRVTKVEGSGGKERTRTTSTRSSTRDSQREKQGEWGFAGSAGVYLNIWHQSPLSAGIPVQLGTEYSFKNMAVGILAEGGIGIGASTFEKRQYLKSPMLEWNYGIAGEFYIPRKKFGLGISLGGADFRLLNPDASPDLSDLSDQYRNFYARFAFIYRNKFKYSFSGTVYRDGNWGLGLRWGYHWGSLKK